MGSKTTNSGSTSVNLPLHFFFTDKQDAEILKLNLGQQLVPFLVVNHGLRFGGADSHSHHFALGCEHFSASWRPPTEKPSKTNQYWWFNAWENKSESALLWYCLYGLPVYVLLHFSPFSFLRHHLMLFYQSCWSGSFMEKVSFVSRFWCLWLLHCHMLLIIFHCAVTVVKGVFYLKRQSFHKLNQEVFIF